MVSFDVTYINNDISFIERILCNSNASKKTRYHKKFSSINVYGTREYNF